MEDLNNKELLELQAFKTAYLELTKNHDIKVLPNQFLIDENIEVAQNILNNYVGADYYNNDDDENISPKRTWNKRLQKDNYREICKNHINKEEFWLGVKLSIVDINDLMEKIPESKVFLENKEFRYKYITNKKTTDFYLIENLVKDKEEKKEILREYINNENPKLQEINFYSNPKLQDALKELLNDESIEHSKIINVIKGNLKLISLISEKDNKLLNDKEIVDGLIVKNQYKEYITNLNEENQIRVIKESDVFFRYIYDIQIIKELEDNSQLEIMKKIVLETKSVSSTILKYFLTQEKFQEELIKEFSKDNASYYFRISNGLSKEDLFTITNILEKNDEFKREKKKYLENWINNIKIVENEDTKITNEIKKDKELQSLLESNEIYKYNKRIWKNNRNLNIENIKQIYQVLNKQGFTEEEKENQIKTAYNHIDVDIKKELRIKKEGIYKYISYEILREELENKQDNNKKVKI